MLQYNYKNNIIAFLVALLLLAISQSSCKKLIEVDSPPNSINESNVYKSDATAIAVLTGIYGRLASNGGLSGTSGIAVLTGLSGDELTLFNEVFDNKFNAYYKNNLRAISPNEDYGSEYWVSLYSYIFAANAAITGISASESLNPAVKQQLIGEAKFIRAFCYFYLINLYGDAPLALSTDPSVNAKLSRMPIEKVYGQIIGDLKDAQNKLAENYLDASLLKATTERLRPTKWAATALLARVYLYTKDYEKAKEQATAIINNTTLYNIHIPLNDVFQKNSLETIWGLQPVAVGRNTEDGITFIIPTTGPNTNVNPVYLSAQLLSSFESGDQRAVPGNWIDTVTAAGVTYYYPYKYKATLTQGSALEYLIVMRLAEQYLIRAEARAQSDDISGARADLNEIRLRAGLSKTAASNKSTLLTAILHERQVELFTEFGHRWLDLKRTDEINDVMGIVTPLKGGTWESRDALYPLPYNDVLRNPNLIPNP